MWVNSAETTQQTCAPSFYFNSIQEAVNQAPAGTEIRVCPGTYRESVNLNLAGSDPRVPQRGAISIIAVGWDDVPSTAQAHDIDSDGVAGFYALLTDVDFVPPTIHIQGFDIGARNGYGIAILANGPRDAIDPPLPDVFVDQVEVQGAPGDGIHIEGGNHVEVTRSKSEENDGFGFFLSAPLDASTVRVEGSHAEGNVRGGVSATGNKVEVSGSTSSEHEGNAFILTGNDVSVSDSSATNNGDSGFKLDGLQFGHASVSDSTATDNEIGFEINNLQVARLVGARSVGDATGLNVTTTAQLLDTVDAGSIFVDDTTVEDSALGFVLSATGLLNNGVPIPGSGNVVVTNSQALVYNGDGFTISATGETRLTNVTAIDGEIDGLSGFVFDSLGPTILTNATALGNDVNGVESAGPGSLTVSNSIVRSESQRAVSLGAISSPAGPAAVNGSLMCDVSSGLINERAGAPDASGNWWGSASGPFNQSENPGGTGVQVDAIAPGDIPDFEPWISKVDGAVLDTARAGQPVTLTFQFSNQAETVFLGQGPGDLNADTAPFSLTTDNGTLTSSLGTGPTVSEFVNQPNGVLQLTLTPATNGPANVTLTGPCGLSAELTVPVGTATFTVHKDFSDDTAVPVEITLTCTSGTIDDSTRNASDNPDTPAVFTVTDFEEGATCTATEPDIQGYEADESECAAVTLLPVTECTIHNLFRESAFTVHKVFSDDTSAPVEITASCTSGQVDDPTKDASDNPDQPATFTVKGYDPGATCTATEPELPGYDSDQLDCKAVALEVRNECTITNTLRSDTLTVHVDFSNSDTRRVRVTLNCTSGLVDDRRQRAGDNPDRPAVYTVSGYDEPVRCNARAPRILGYLRDRSDCRRVDLGERDSCTIAYLKITILLDLDGAGNGVGPPNIPSIP